MKTKILILFLITSVCSFSFAQKKIIEFVGVNKYGINKSFKISENRSKIYAILKNDTLKWNKGKIKIIDSLHFNLYNKIVQDDKIILMKFSNDNLYKVSRKKYTYRKLFLPILTVMIGMTAYLSYDDNRISNAFLDSYALLDSKYKYAGGFIFLGSTIGYGIGCILDNMRVYRNAIRVKSIEITKKYPLPKIKQPFNEAMGGAFIGGIMCSMGGYVYNDYANKNTSSGWYKPSPIYGGIVGLIYGMPVGYLINYFIIKHKNKKKLKLSSSLKY